MLFGSPLTQDNVAQIYQLIEFLGRSSSMYIKSFCLTVVKLSDNRYMMLPSDMIICAEFVLRSNH